MAKQLTAELPFGRVSNQRLYFVNGKLSTVHLIETPGAYFKEAVVLYTQQTGVFFLIVSTVSSKRCIFWRTFEHKPLLGHVIYINILAWLRCSQDNLLYLVFFSLYPSLFG